MDEIESVVECPFCYAENWSIDGVCWNCEEVLR